MCVFKNKTVVCTGRPCILRKGDAVICCNGRIADYKGRTITDPKHWALIKRRK